MNCQILCVCVCVCVRACMRACVRVCVCFFFLFFFFFWWGWVKKSIISLWSAELVQRVVKVNLERDNWRLASRVMSVLQYSPK